MLGDSLLVAPVFDEHAVEYYVPEGAWTNVLTDEVVRGPRWVREEHGFDSVPLLARPGSVVPFGARTDRPDYDYAEGVQLRAYQLAEGEEVRLELPTADGAASAGRFTVRRQGGRLEASTDADVASWSLRWHGRDHRAHGQSISIDLEDDAT